MSVEWAKISQVDATINLLLASTSGGYDYYWLISGQDWPICSVNEIIRFFESQDGKNYIQYWNSKNYGDHKQNNLDKRNQICFSQKIIGRGIVQKVIKRSWVELTGGYNRTWRLFERKQLPVKFYFGSSWWALGRDTVDWIMEYLAKHEEYYAFYCNTVCPDESFFQTLVMLSPFADDKMDYLTYLNFPVGANSPVVLRKSDWEKAKNSGYLIMRKVDLNVDDFFVKL